MPLRLFHTIVDLLTHLSSYTKSYIINKVSTGQNIEDDAIFSNQSVQHFKAGSSYVAYLEIIILSLYPLYDA
jgi:hypothetical protein